LANDWNTMEDIGIQLKHWCLDEQMGSTYS